MFPLLFPQSELKRGGTSLWCSAWAEVSIAFAEDDEDDVYLISIGNVNRQRLLYHPDDLLAEPDESQTSIASFFLWACLWREIEQLWIDN